MFKKNKNNSWIVDKYFKQKCDACNFDSDKDILKIYNITGQRFTCCHNFDKTIENKKDSCHQYPEFECFLKCEIHQCSNIAIPLEPVMP